MDVDYSRMGHLLSSPARSAMLARMFEGEPVSATALARSAGVAPSTASEHLRALVDGGLVTVVAQGRQRHYGIASPEIAEALEALGRVCPRAPVRSLRASQDAGRMNFARSCYDHLAGQVGVAVFDALLDSGWIVTEGALVRLGPQGARFRELGVEPFALQGQRRCFARTCLDGTERRPHLAGALGAALCRATLDRKWFARIPHGRGLRLTEVGRVELPCLLGIDPSGLSATGAYPRVTPA